MKAKRIAEFGSPQTCNHKQSLRLMAEAMAGQILLHNCILPCSPEPCHSRQRIQLALLQSPVLSQLLESVDWSGGCEISDKLHKKWGARMLICQVSWARAQTAHTDWSMSQMYTVRLTFRLSCFCMVTFRRPVTPALPDNEGADASRPNPLLA